MPQNAAPNILVIMGDDIGWFNPSCYNSGIMGYQTPNIDRIAKEGARFTDWYGQQSCTAGRAAFITGQSPIRTGLTKVGLPGSDIGLQAEDPSVAELQSLARSRADATRRQTAGSGHKIPGRCSAHRHARLRVCRGKRLRRAPKTIAVSAP